MTRRASTPRGHGAAGRSTERDTQRGFTLIEVLVAVALMAIVSVLAWRGLDSVVRTRDHVQRDADRDDALLRVLGQLQQDAQMRAPDTVLDGGATEAVVKRMLPAALRVDAAHNGSAVDIVRGPAPAGGWQIVRWWLDGNALRRSAAPASNAFPLPQPGAGVDVLDGVVGFSVQAWVPDHGWTPITGDGDDGNTATGLVFVLRLAPTGNGPEQVYRRVVALR